MICPGFPLKHKKGTWSKGRVPSTSTQNCKVTDLLTFRIKIGNLVADVQSNHSYLERICRPYLSLELPVCNICIDKPSIECERRAALEYNMATGNASNEMEDWFLEVYALLHKLLPILPEYKMLFMHGSAIEYKGKAYIFVAPSGTGKSTHTRLWKELFGTEVTVINDDKPFLSFRDGKVYVCGTPWRGKHNIGQNVTAELGGICILCRGETNEIHMVDSADSVKEIIQQSNLHRYKDNALLALDLIDMLLKTVPVYRLFCTPTMDAVEVCHNEIIK